MKQNPGPVATCLACRTLMVTRRCIFFWAVRGRKKEKLFVVFKFRTKLYSYRLYGLCGSRPSRRLSFADGFSCFWVLFSTFSRLILLNWLGGERKNLGVSQYYLRRWWAGCAFYMLLWINERKKNNDGTALNAAAIWPSVRFRWAIWPLLLLIFFYLTFSFLYFNGEIPTLSGLMEWAKAL